MQRHPPRPTRQVRRPPSSRSNHGRDKAAAPPPPSSSPRHDQRFSYPVLCDRCGSHTGQNRTGRLGGVPPWSSLLLFGTTLGKASGLPVGTAEPHRTACPTTNYPPPPPLSLSSARGPSLRQSSVALQLQITCLSRYTCSSCHLISPITRAPYSNLVAAQHPWHSKQTWFVITQRVCRAATNGSPLPSSLSIDIIMYSRQMPGRLTRSAAINVHGIYKKEQKNTPPYHAMLPLKIAPAFLKCRIYRPLVVTKGSNRGLPRVGPIFASHRHITASTLHLG